MATWPLARRVAQLLVVSDEESDVGAVAQAVQGGAGGVDLYGDEAPPDLGSQVQALVAAAPAGVPPVVMTDEEGGEVQRMANLVGNLPWPATMAQTMTPAAVQALAETLGRNMAANGVRMDLAPVIDLAAGPGPDDQHPDGPRAFGLSPQTATTYGLAFARGLQAGGVIPVVKHFPGEGQTVGNTDDAPASTPPLSELRAADLLPFGAAAKAGLPAVMVGNASVPGLTSAPASLSSAVIEGLLRHQLGFRGLVMTDALSAGAISDIGLTVPEAAEESVAAGADMILYDSDNPDATFAQTVQALAGAVTSGRLPIATVDRADVVDLQTKGINLCPAAKS